MLDGRCVLVESAGVSLIGTEDATASKEDRIVFDGDTILIKTGRVGLVMSIVEATNSVGSIESELLLVLISRRLSLVTIMADKNGRTCI